MKYIESTLIKDEQVILEPVIHPIVYVKPFILFGAILMFLLGVGLVEMSIDAWSVILLITCFIIPVFIIWLIYDKLYYTRLEMAVTNKRVVCKTGIISVHSEELQWNKIESIETRQGILGRIFGYGDVYFSGTGASYVVFPTIREPWQVKSKSAEILSK